MEELTDFKAYNYKDLPPSFCMICCASRRSGKGVMTNHLIQQIQKSNNKFTHIFLVSKTDAGYEGIPSGYRYDSLDIIDKIVSKQKAIKEHNKTNKDKIDSKILIVVDDMADSNDLRVSATLNNLFLNGRHISGGTNTLSIILTTQSLTAINKKIRLNTDLIAFNSLSSRNESALVMDECFFVLGTSRSDINYARDIYHKLVSSKEYRFIMVSNFTPNKRKLSDYISTYDAKINKDFKFFNNKVKKTAYKFNSLS
jgi:hypothetical protein